MANLKEVLKPNEVDPTLLKRIKAMYGEIDMKNDFFSKDLDTYFKTSGINPETNSVEHKVIKLASFSDSLKKVSSAVKALKQLVGTDEGRNDEKIKNIADELKAVFNTYRTHLRKNYPDQYNQIKDTLEEISTTGGTASFTPGTGALYATPFDFNPNRKAKGTARNYYYKLGYKPVDREKLRKKTKGIEYKKLFEI